MDIHTVVKKINEAASGGQTPEEIAADRGWTVIGNHGGIWWFEQAGRATKDEADAECIRLSNMHSDRNFAVVYMG